MIHRAHSNNRGRERRQSGIALVVSLVMLLATTLIGVTIARVTTLQERMAGNMRQQSVSFEGAELMLREGEAWLEDQTGKAARPADVAPANCGTPRAMSSTTRPAHPTTTRWTRSPLPPGIRAHRCEIAPSWRAR